MEIVLDVMDRPWRWGESDCCAAACEVFRRLHGVDPMASLRGTYASRTGADIVISGMGGMTAMAEMLAARAGLLRIEPGGEGDIGLTPPRPEGRALCICVGAGWAAKSARGFVVLPVAERAWTWPR